MTRLDATPERMRPLTPAPQGAMMVSLGKYVRYRAQAEGGPTGGVAPGHDRLSLALALGAAVAWSVLGSVRGWPCIVAAVVLTVGGAAGLRSGRREAAALALGTAGLATLVSLPFARFVPAPLLLVVAGILLACRFRVPWLERGEMGGTVALWIGAIVVISASALGAWWAIARPDLADLPFPSWLRAIHPAVLAALAIGWAALNAAAEELYFRGALQHALVRALGRGGVIVQAAAFGLAHVKGFPRGASGVALATIYGLMLGVLRQRAGGLLAPWAAHLGADLVIATIVVVMAH